MTCHFAQGTSCRGCLIRVQWSDTDTAQSVTFSQELVVKRLSGSLTASGTIEHLLPGHRYTVVAYDMEEDGNVSTIGVPLDGQLFTTRAGMYTIFAKEGSRTLGLGSGYMYYQ